MKKIAIFLALICGGLYGWGQYQTLLNEEKVLDIENVQPPKEVFPDSMKNIISLKQAREMIESEKKSQQAALEALRIAQEKEARIKAEEQERQAKALAQQKALELEKQQKELEKFCVKMGTFTSKQLPAVNQSLKASNLLEKVQIKPLFGQDRFVVFIIPTTSLKGAQALVKQVKDKGYTKAEVITSGPLTNATRLNIFDNEANAISYLEKAKKSLNMKSIRMTRLMGEPTGNVILLFEGLTQKEKEQLQKIARQQKRNLESCSIDE